MRPSAQNLQGKWVMVEDHDRFVTIRFHGSRYHQVTRPKTRLASMFAPLVGNQVMGRWSLRDDALFLKKRALGGGLLGHFGPVASFATSWLARFSDLLIPDPGRPILDVSDRVIRFRDGESWRKL